MKFTAKPKRNVGVVKLRICIKTKKTLSLLLLCLVCIGTVGCGGDGSQEIVDLDVNDCSQKNCNYSSTYQGYALHSDDPEGMFSYASSGCVSLAQASHYPGIRKWDGDNCGSSDPFSGRIWVR